MGYLDDVTYYNSNDQINNLYFIYTEGKRKLDTESQTMAKLTKKGILILNLIKNYDTLYNVCREVLVNNPDCIIGFDLGQSHTLRSFGLLPLVQEVIYDLLPNMDSDNIKLYGEHPFLTKFEL